MPPMSSSPTDATDAAHTGSAVRTFDAVLWDFGGVILSSPFDAFGRYEREHGLPVDFIRTVNATDPHTNAWARLERNDITAAAFDEVFARSRLAAS